MTTEFDADRVELTAALRAFTRQSAGADISLVSYAGHGIEMDGVNHLVPVDAHLERDVDVRFETVTVDDLLVPTSGASLRLLIVEDRPRQHVEPLIRNQQVSGSSPLAGSSLSRLFTERYGTLLRAAFVTSARVGCT